MHGIVVYRFQGVEGLLAAHRLLQRCGLLPAPRLSMEPEYLAAGFEGNQAAVLVASVGDRSVGFLPYAVRRGRMPYRLGPLTVATMPYRELRIYGYHGDGEDHHAVLTALFTHLRRQVSSQVDVGVLSELSMRNPLRAFLEQPPEQVRRWLCIKLDKRDSYRVEVKGSFEDYLKQRMGKKARYNLRRTLKLLDDSAGGPARVGTYTRPSQVDEFLRYARDIARLTYQWRLGYDTIRGTPRERDKLSFLADRGMLRSYILFTGDRPVAYCFGLVHNRVFEYNTVGYDPRVAALRPGTVLLYHILADLFNNRLADEVDFGAGPGEYKRMFSNTNPGVVYARIYVRELYPQVLSAMDGARRWLNKTCKPWVGRIVRQMVMKRPQPSAVPPEPAESSREPAKEPTDTPAAGRGFSQT